MKTTHEILLQDARELEQVPDDSVDLVVTSPPYPMIEMWDDMFFGQDPKIQQAFEQGDGQGTFELMHQILDAVWKECARVLKPGRFLCINIGDATRKIQDDFCLYSNHSRILTYLLNAGFVALPDILWRKQTNAPNKFMGSGMLPAGAYVTLEHEYILILRKGSKRLFKTAAEKKNRQESAIFWEERNHWYSDVWMDLKGAGQGLSDEFSRLRSAAFPFDLVYRLVNMYSVKGDVVLDPFLGTGTTALASMASKRNSIGVEVDAGMLPAIQSWVPDTVDFSNAYMRDRISKHIKFVVARTETHGPLKYMNKHYGFPVVTGQEQQLIFNNLKKIRAFGEQIYEVEYTEIPQELFDHNGDVEFWTEIESKKKKQSDSVQYELLS